MVLWSYRTVLTKIANFRESVYVSKMAKRPPFTPKEAVPNSITLTKEEATLLSRSTQSLAGMRTEIGQAHIVYYDMEQQLAKKKRNIDHAIEAYGIADKQANETLVKLAARHGLDITNTKNMRWSLHAETGLLTGVPLDQ
jgi:hypothetical protein